jgi:hypothetical protein
MALHQVQALFEQAQQRRRCARVLSQLFEIHNVLLLPHEALARIDDQPIGNGKVTIPSLHQRVTSPLGALRVPMPPAGILRAQQQRDPRAVAAVWSGLRLGSSPFWGT